MLLKKDSFNFIDKVSLLLTNKNAKNLIIKKLLRRKMHMHGEMKFLVDLVIILIAAGGGTLLCKKMYVNK